MIARPVAPGADIGVDCKSETVYVKKCCIEDVVFCMQGTVQVSLSDASGMRLSMASANDVVIPSGDSRSDGASDRTDRKQFEALRHL